MARFIAMAPARPSRYHRLTSLDIRRFERISSCFARCCFSFRFHN